MTSTRRSSAGSAPWRAVRTSPAIVSVVALTIVCATGISLLLEFGALWLVALGASAVWFGPHWAALATALGLGGLLAGRLRLSQAGHLAPVVAVLLVAALTPTRSSNLAVLIVAQGVLTLLVVTASIHANGLLHHGVPSTVRSSVASGVSALSWMVFLPVALLVGAVIDSYGVFTAGWILVAIAGSTAVILTSRRNTPVATAPVVRGAGS